ncbi:TetR/AcrR family transcriptional regulator [Fervidibacillus halotolerans]|uniref:TetR/AcrR family transcriptional regulator n=1 Tax=Fervidibacillus halotolerans TaxID=2980027 RepID=A0A9E8M024_9BACI|nr:TetR/AcrR family transcriptional regulator [Fervidibacillus halotolerans]WAA12867.1 TetR/AcrR family transcriptional regulator [Fervidibacillus halotolerans]
MAPKVSEEYKEKKRQDLLKSAMACFAEKGYQTATIDDIVTHSGMSKGAFYNYFSSKEEIYLTLLKQSVYLSFQKLREAIQSKETAKEKLKHVFDIYSNLDFTKKSIQNHRVQIEFWIIASRNDNLIDHMKTHAKVFHDFLIEIIEEGQKKSEFSKDIKSADVSEIFWAITDGLFLHMLVEKDEFPMKRLYQTAGKMILKYLEK